MHVEYGPTREDDLESLIDLCWTVAGEDRWIATEIPFDRAARLQAFRETSRRSDALSLVARANGGVIGQISLRPSRPGVVSLGMLVAADWRSRGVGRHLFDSGIAWARTADVEKIDLEVFPDNAKAIALYERAGFVREGYLRQNIRRRDGSLRDRIAMAYFIEPLAIRAAPVT